MTDPVEYLKPCRTVRLLAAGWHWTDTRAGLANGQTGS